MLCGAKRPIDSVVSYIEAIQQMTERDFIVLQVVNRIMNKSGDWKTTGNSVLGPIPKLHPSTLIGRAQELSVQIAIALGQATERDTLQSRGRLRDLQPP